MRLMGPIRLCAAAFLAASAFPGWAFAGRPPERLRVAVVARQPGDWAAAGIARVALAQLSRLDPVWPANLTAAQRLVPTSEGASAEAVAKAGRLLRCHFVAVVGVRGRGEAAADLVEVATAARQRLVASGELHELPCLLALALAEAMRVEAPPAARARLAIPAVSSEAAAEALWRGDAAGQPEEQMRLYEGGLKADPDSALVHNQLGATFGRAGQPLRALAEFGRAIALDPDYAAAHTNRGTVLRQERRWDEAERAFRAAIRLGAKSPTPHVALARLLDRVGDLIEAVDELERALDADPSHVETLMTLADSYFESLNFRAVREMAERVLEVEPDHHGALNLLGLLLLVPHDYEEAEAMFLRALTVKPEDPETLSNLALALYGEGEGDMAVGVLKRVVARDPGYANAHLYLGRIHLAQDRPKEAAAALQRAAELHPTMGDAQRGLATARSAAARQPGCGCLGIQSPFDSLFSANHLVGPLLPFALLLAPHIRRLARRRRRGVAVQSGPGEPHRI
ncbi:MAG TPA: tetratricopeptide repeat protein [Planctomycetota bacterium]|nr:tetratricopeptide repeat protein [Planctomycetota bacterium]